MLYLLDTNICVYGIKKLYPHLSKLLTSIDTDIIKVSSVTIGELTYGCCKSAWGSQTQHTMELFLSPFEVFPFTEDDAKCFGRIRAQLEKAGTPIGPYDMQIAAQGLSRHMTVVTHNTREFLRVPDLMVEDWIIEDPKR